jgi:hypothetical protein
MTMTKPISPISVSAGKSEPNAAAVPQNEVVSLKTICVELKLDPRLAREKLRVAARDAKKFPDLAKARKPRTAWEWPKGSPAEQQARGALKV